MAFLGVKRLDLMHRGRPRTPGYRFRSYSADVEKRYALYSARGLSSSYTGVPAVVTSISLEGPAKPPVYMMFPFGNP